MRAFWPKRWSRNKEGSVMETIRRGVFGSVLGTALVVAKPDGRVVAIFGHRDTRKANLYLETAGPDLWKAYAPGDIRLGEHVPIACKRCGKFPRLAKDGRGWTALSGCGALSSTLPKREEAVLDWNAQQARAGAVL